jgi:hypothetical protein
MVVKADKGKTCVIIYTDEYNEKVHNFLNENNFQKLKKYPMDKYQSLSPRPYNIVILLSIRNKRSTSPTRNPNPPT